MSVLKKYEIMILLTEEFNDSELKTWVFNYAKNLRKFNVCDILNDFYAIFAITES